MRSITRSLRYWVYLVKASFKVGSMGVNVAMVLTLFAELWELVPATVKVKKKRMLSQRNNWRQWKMFEWQREGYFDGGVEVWMPWTEKTCEESVTSLFFFFIFLFFFNQIKIRNGIAIPHLHICLKWRICIWQTYHCKHWYEWHL